MTGTKNLIDDSLFRYWYIATSYDGDFLFLGYMPFIGMAIRGAVVQKLAFSQS